MATSAYDSPDGYLFALSMNELCILCILLGSQLQLSTSIVYTYRLVGYASLVRYNI